MTKAEKALEAGNRIAPAKDTDPIGPWDPMTVNDVGQVVHGRFDTAARLAFLNAYGECGVLYRAAEAANVCMSTINYHRKKDSTLEEDMEVARQNFVGRLEQEANRRAVEGWDEPVFYKGETQGYVRKFSDRLLELQLRSHSARHTTKVEATTTNTNRNVNTNMEVDADVDWDNLTDEQLEAVRVLTGAKG